MEDMLSDAEKFVKQAMMNERNRSKAKWHLQSRTPTKAQIE
jgi:hypothetical protein